MVGLFEMSEFAAEHWSGPDATTVAFAPAALGRVDR